MNKDITDLTTKAQEYSMYIKNIAEIGIEAIHCFSVDDSYLLEQVLAILEASKLFAQQISDLIGEIEAAETDRKQELA